MIQFVILCGGIGSRLWPLSRECCPKQFIEFDKKGTLFKNTVLRARHLCNSKNFLPLIITNREQKILADSNLKDINVQAQFIIEPIQRNTAPAICAAAYALRERDPVLVVFPSDHMLADIDKFRNKLDAAEKLANKGQLVTFGIVPNRAETGYGYIKVGSKIENNAYEIDSFIEKPNKSRAEMMTSSGEYLWNSGIFAFKASSYLNEMNLHNPRLLKQVEKALNSGRTYDNIVEINATEFAKCENISVDYAVFEKTSNSVVVPIENAWSDLGTWQSIYNTSEKDSDNNVMIGDVIARDTRNCYVQSSRKLVATIGLRNLAIVETGDSILISSLDQTQDVKNLYTTLKDNHRKEVEFNSIVQRPWGSYESLFLNDRFQVKRIIVKSGEELSLQKHFHRAEHWIVVQGTAEVIIGDEKLLLSENQSTYIPLGVKHQLINPGKIPLIVIEVQSGSYLGEDDIVRYTDKYNRK